jgi:hypothetical protein
VNRLKLEKEFASLSSPSSQATVQKGEGYLKSTGKSILKENVTKIAKAQVAHVLAKALEARGHQHLADAVRSSDEKARIKDAAKKAEKEAKKAADTPKPHNETSTPSRSRPMSSIPAKIVPNPAYRRSSRATKIYEVTTLGRN